MKVNKKIIISILFILTIFTIINGVSASDTTNESSTISDINTNDISHDTKNTIPQSDTNKESEISEDKETSPNQDTLKEDTENKDIYVSIAGSDLNDGKNRENATTLSNAINIAQDGSTIHIDKGHYITKDLGIISNRITINGEDEVILDGNKMNRILYMGNTSEVVIKNIIMINGYTPLGIESGALLGNAGNLTIINCTFKDSSSEKNGGAIYNAGNLIIINSTFENNYAEKNGGAIFSQNGGTGIIPSLSVDNCIFRNNTAKGNSNYGGGAIYIQSASSGNSLGLANITNTLFENNKVTNYGGGAIEISLTNTAIIDNCSFINNSANGGLDNDKSNYGGGAISFIGSYGSLNEILTITNSLFLNNTAKNYGGGAIYTRYAQINIKNSVLINNKDESKGYAIYRRVTDMNTAKVTANDNWWGSNDNPKSNINAGTLNRWVILTITNETEIKEGKTTKILVKLDSYTDGTNNGTLTNPIMIERPLLICTNLGNIKGKLVNGEYSLNYTIPHGLKIISTKVDSQQEVLFVLTSQVKVELLNISGHMGNRINYTVNVTTIDDSVIINTGNVEIYFDDELITKIPVINGQAKSQIMISKTIGNYTITGKFIDLTQEFETKTKNAKLSVDGIDNIVNKETFSNFFDGENILKSDLPFDELFFEGEIHNKILTINKNISLIGKSAVFNNTSLKIIADNVKVSSINFISNQTIDNTYSVIYVEGENTIIENNNITYNPPNNDNSYAIYLDFADKTQIINNNIQYTAYKGNYIQTITLYALYSDDLTIKDNVFNISIPSVSLADYGDAPYYYGTANSAGLVIERSKRLNLDNNTININYNGFDEFADTINGVHIKFCDNSKISNNNIELKGHSYAYSLYIDGSENVMVSKNNILAEADDKQANTISVNGKTSVNIEYNNITAIAKIVTYPIYLNDLTYLSKTTLKNNNIKGNANTVYGIYTEEKTSDIINNNIEVIGNYTIGIASHKTELTITNNTIDSKGTNTGFALGLQGSTQPETTAITSSNSNIKIINNTFISTGNYTINVINCNGTIKDNNLTAVNGITGDNTLNKTDSNLIIDNNKTSQNIIELIIPIDPNTYDKNNKNNNTPINTNKINPALNQDTTNKKTYKVTIYLSLKKIQKVSKKVKKLYLKLTIKSNGKKIKTKNITLKVKSNNVQVKKIKNSKKNKLSPIQSFKFTVKINTQGYTAKTNKKGKTIFKINNIHKKGKYTAKISYKSIKFYSNSKNIKFMIN